MGSVLSVVTLAQLVEAGSPDTEPYSGAESRGQPPAQPWYISVTTPGNSNKQENTFSSTDLDLRRKLYIPEQINIHYWWMSVC